MDYSNCKVSVQDVQNCMRDHYEGTALAIDSSDIGGGIWQMPYRPTPLVYKVNGKIFQRTSYKHPTNRFYLCFSDGIMASSSDRWSSVVW